MKQFCVIFTEEEMRILFEQTPFDEDGNVNEGIYNALCNAQETFPLD